MTRPVDASKVKCYGPGVDRVNPLFSKTPQEFTVDTTEAGDADLEVTVETPDRKTLKPEPVCEKGDGVYTVAYTPEDEGKLWYMDTSPELAKNVIVVVVVVIAIIVVVDDVV